MADGSSDYSGTVGNWRPWCSSAGVRKFVKSELTRADTCPSARAHLRAAVRHLPLQAADCHLMVQLRRRGGKGHVGGTGRGSCVAG